MKPWRLTKTAEKRLADIAEQTAREFGIDQAIKYRDALIARINALASGEPPHPRNCEILAGNRPKAAGLSYYREGGHFIIMRDTDELLEVIEVLHERSDLPRHIDRLTEGS